MTDKILILGASCDLGRRLSRRFEQNQIIASYCSTPIEGGVYFDALDMKLDDIVSEPNDIGHAFIFIAESNPNKCVEDLPASTALNVDAIKRVIDRLEQWNIHPIFTSTEVVFDGANAPYLEEDYAKPIMTYGSQKLYIEKYIESACDNYTIFRLSRMYGDTPGDGTLFMDWIQSLKTDDVIQCADDQKFSPVFIEDVVDTLHASVERQINGLYHVGGPEGMSRYEMLSCLSKAMKKYHLVEATVHPCSINDFNFREDRPKDVSLNSDRIYRETELVFSTVEEMCAKFTHSLIGSIDVKRQ